MPCLEGCKPKQDSPHLADVPVRVPGELERLFENLKIRSYSCLEREEFQ